MKDTTIDMMKHGYPIDVKWEFWSAAGKIRNDMDQSLSPHEKAARAQEQAAQQIADRIDTLWRDRLCDPWFQ